MSIDEFINDLRLAISEDPLQPFVDVGFGYVDDADTIGIDGNLNLRFLAEYLTAVGYRKVEP
jgi:hypothetical protein